MKIGEERITKEIEGWDVWGNEVESDIILHSKQS